MKCVFLSGLIKLLHIFSIFFHCFNELPCHDLMEVCVWIHTLTRQMCWIQISIKFIWSINIGKLNKGKRCILFRDFPIYGSMQFILDQNIEWMWIWPNSLNTNHCCSNKLTFFIAGSFSPTNSWIHLCSENFQSTWHRNPWYYSVI